MNALFPTNEGKLDRGIRVVLGLALLTLVLVGPETLWGLLGMIPLLIGALGSCPLYRLMRTSTCGARGSS